MKANPQIHIWKRNIKKMFPYPTHEFWYFWNWTYDLVISKIIILLVSRVFGTLKTSFLTLKSWILKLEFWDWFKKLIPQKTKFVILTKTLQTAKLSGQPYLITNWETNPLYSLLENPLLLVRQHCFRFYIWPMLLVSYVFDQINSRL